MIPPSSASDRLTSILGNAEWVVRRNERANDPFAGRERASVREESNKLVWSGTLSLARRGRGASDEDDDDPSALAARGRIHVGTAVDDGPRPRVLARHPARARRAVDAALGARRAPGVAETRAATARIVVRASSRRSTDEISARCDRLLSTPSGVRLGADLVSSRGD